MDWKAKVESGEWRQLAAMWTDEKGDNIVNGPIFKADPLQIVSSQGRGIVTIPKGAKLYRPARPQAIEVGVV